jgi:phage terminase large subunit
MEPFWHGVSKEEREKIRKALISPIEFSRKFLGSAPWEIQQQIMTALDQPNARVAVKACHASGKTWLAGASALHGVARFKEVKIITTAPSWNQVEYVMWPEIRTLIANSKYPYPKPLLTELQMGPKRFIIGFATTVTKSNEGVRFQGYHAEHIIIIMDEAPGIDPKIWEAIEGIRAGGDVRVLALGNPTITGGEFHDAFGSKRAAWTAVFTISAFNTPNLIGCCIKYRHPNTGEEVVLGDPNGENLLTMSEADIRKTRVPYLTTRAWVRERFHEWGPTSPVWEARVLGEFPSQSEFSLIPLSWIERCANIDTKPQGPPESVAVEDVIFGIDVAGPGEAYTKLVGRCGNRVIVEKRYHQADPRGAVLADMEPFRSKTSEVRVDCIGIGWGFYLHIKDAGYKTIPVNVTVEPRDKKKYHRLKDEAYWQVRQKFEKSQILGALDQNTISQLSSIRYEHNSRGQIQVESKDQMKARGIPSPDDAEGFMLCFGDFTLPFLGVMEYYEDQTSEKDHEREKELVAT